LTPEPFDVVATEGVLSMLDGVAIHESRDYRIAAAGRKRFLPCSRRGL
jgi:hypothetical protein